MRFRFIGDANGDGPDSVKLFGLSFTKGEPVEVSDPHAVAKLQGNSHFEAVRGRKPGGKNGTHKGRDEEQNSAPTAGVARGAGRTIG